MGDAVKAHFCTQCGEPVSGRYCANCGTKVEGPAHVAMDAVGTDLWLSLAGEVLPEGLALKLPAVALGFLNRPVETTLKLTADATYTGQWKVLLAGMAAYFGLYEAVMPHLAQQFHFAVEHEDKAAILAHEVAVLIGLFMLVPLFYYVCRWFSLLDHTPRSYLKLAVLGFGYWYMLDTVLEISITSAFVVLSALTKAVGLTSLQPVIGTLDVGVVMIARHGSVLWLFQALHRRFWQVDGLVALGVAVGFLVGARWLVYPLVELGTHAIDLAGILRQVTG